MTGWHSLHCQRLLTKDVCGSQVLAAEAEKEAMVPYIKVFQTLLR